MTTESIHPHRSEFIQLEARLDMLENTVNRQVKIFEQQRETLQDIADHMTAFKRDYEEMKKATSQRDLEWQEEKGKMMSQLARDTRAINERFDQLDQNDIKQNTKISAIEASVTGFQEAAKLVIEEIQDRKRGEERTKHLLGRIELYSRATLSLAGVGAILWAIFKFAVRMS